MPFFSVTVQASVAILIEAETEAEAIENAFIEVNFSDAGHKETGEATELKTQEEIDRAHRHADQIIQG